MNLLLNAIKANESNGHITLRTGCENESAWVEVPDDGCGITQGKGSTFRVSLRVSGTTTTHEGTALA